MIIKNILPQIEQMKIPKEGEIVEGKVIGAGSSGVFVELGNFGTGIISKKEVEKAKDVIKKIKPGDTVSAKIIEEENEDGYIELSLNEAVKELSWNELEDIKKEDRTIEIKISKANKGGLIAELNGVNGFLPLSQLSLIHYPRVEQGDSKKIVWELQKLIGETMEVKILDLDLKHKKLIFSEKAKEAQGLKEILKQCQEGDKVNGEITGVTDFGIFIKFMPSGAKKEDLMQLEGLIHISEIELGKAKNPSDLFKTGQTVKAKIIKIADNKVFLSLKP